MLCAVVTVEEILTMTSGLVNNAEDPTGDDSCGGGCFLEDSLSIPDIGVKGEFSYLILSNIPSYIIQERTGMTPRQYLAERVMVKLGVGEDEYDWIQNSEFGHGSGIETAFGFMFLTPMQLAKFGQLYLQGGRTNPSTDERVISQKWIDASFTKHVVGTDTEDVMGMGTFPYGYFFFNLYGSAWCAVGLHGQYICVDRDLDRVVIQQRDSVGINLDDFPVPTALDASLSFRADAADDGVFGIEKLATQ